VAARNYETDKQRANDIPPIVTVPTAAKAFA
jgi:hypothetical protein